MAERLESSLPKGLSAICALTERGFTITNYARAFYYLYLLERRARWPPGRLEEYRDEQLRRMIRYSYDHVPFYRKRFKEANVDPGDIRTRHDLNKLPVIKKNDIRQNLNEMISDEFDISQLRKMSTSGSSGEPLFIYLSESEVEFRKAKHLRANISLGQRPWDRWVTITGPHHFGKTTRLQRLFGLYVPTTLSVFNDAQTQISLLEELRPAVLDGYSSSLFLLAKEVEKQGVKSINPRFIIGGAELVDSHSRRYVESVFRVPFYDQYSSVEFERMAWECPKREGYHIDADAMILQFLGKDEEEVSPGENGAIVCTSFFNFAMPLIRYAIGDVGIPSENTCSCGRTLPLMQMVEGRQDSLLLLPNGQMLTPRTFTNAIHLSKYYDRIEQFRLTQKKLDYFEIMVKTKGDVQESILEQELVGHLRSTLALDEGVQLQVRLVEQIPLSKSGKSSTVVSELARNNDK